MKYLFSGLVCLALLSQPAQAWSRKGHVAIASIAEANLTPAAQARVKALLKNDLDVFGQVLGRRSLSEIASWADEMRDWVSRPSKVAHSRANPVCRDEPGPCKNGNCVDQNIRAYLAVLKSADSTQRERNEALKFIVHLVGDLHQPLHAGRVEDRGGNEVVLIDEEKPDRAPVRLHSWWDDLPGPGGLRGKRLIKRAGELIADHLPPPQDKPAQWLEESRQLTDDAYPKRQREGKLLADRGFKDAASEIATGRIIAAGYRLARQLDDIRAARVSRGTR